MFLVRQVASLRSPLELPLNLGYSKLRSQKQNRQGEFQAHLISVASVNVLVLAVPPVFFAFPWTSPLEPLGLDFVLSAWPICHGLNPVNIMTIPQRSCSSRMEMLVTNSIAVQNFSERSSRLIAEIHNRCRSILFKFWALICHNSWNSIQSDTLISTSLSGTANNQAHRHFEAVELEKIAFKFTFW